MNIKKILFIIPPIVAMLVSTAALITILIYATSKTGLLSQAALEVIPLAILAAAVAGAVIFLLACTIVSAVHTTLFDSAKKQKTATNKNSYREILIYGWLGGLRYWNKILRQS